MKIPVSPHTRAALRVLVAKGLEQLIMTGTAEPIRAARRNARGLEVKSTDGRTYSGVVVIHRNTVTTGVVVEDSVTDELALPAVTGELAADLNTALHTRSRS